MILDLKITLIFYNLKFLNQLREISEISYAFPNDCNFVLTIFLMMSISRT